MLNANTSNTFTTSRAFTLKPALTIVTLLSGIAGLGYQILWIRLFSVTFGNEVVSVMAVIGAFFFGLACGAFFLSAHIQQTRQPAKWYLGLEITIAVWALLLITFAPSYTRFFAQALGTSPPIWLHLFVVFTSAFVLLFPATFAMGATLPALERAARSLNHEHTAIAGLYSINTMGAVFGTLGATFLLIPRWGLTNTTLAFVFLNFFCAAVVFFLQRELSLRIPPALHPTTQFSSKVSSNSLRAWLFRVRSHSRLVKTLFLTGAAGIGYEVLAIRVISQVMEDTVYTYALALAIYLLGTALGAYVYGIVYRIACKRKPHLPLNDSLNPRLLLSTAVAVALGLSLLWAINSVYQWLLMIFPTGLVGALLAEILVAGMVFFIPTLFMGALFSHLARQAIPTIGLGTALGFNTFGGALAPGVFSVLLLPWLGAKFALVSVLMIYIALAVHQKKIPVIVLSCAILLAAFFAPPLRFITMEPNGKILSYDDGLMAAVTVVEDQHQHRHLKVNNHFTMGGTASRFSDHRQTHLPMLLHGSPKSALYLGLGTGITFDAAKYYSRLKATGVELVPEIPKTFPYFGVHPHSHEWIEQPQIIVADARRFVLGDQQKYDVIIAEIFHPSRDGAGALYAVEHYRAIKERLNNNGKFCQWLPLFQLDIPTLKTIIRSFIDVFPYAQMHLGHFSLQQPILCLLGSQQALNFEQDWLINRVFDPRLQQQLVQARLNSDFALFGGYLADRDALKRFAGMGPLNTDDLPDVIYSAPQFVYTEQAAPAKRLVHLLDSFKDGRRHILDNNLPANQTEETKSNPSLFYTRLVNYWKARDVFLHSGVDVDISGDLDTLVSQTKGPLLQAAALSEDFYPAYDPLLKMASDLFKHDQQQAAKALLLELEQAQPKNHEAKRLREALFSPKGS